MRGETDGLMLTLRAKETMVGRSGTRSQKKDRSIYVDEDRWMQLSQTNSNIELLRIFLKSLKICSR